MAVKGEAEILAVAGHEVAISHPQKVLFPGPRHTKLDLARYYLSVAEGALRGAGPAALDRGGRAAFPVGPGCRGGGAA